MRKVLACILAITAAGVVSAQTISNRASAPAVQPMGQQRHNNDPGRVPQRARLTTTKLGPITSIATVSNPRAAQAKAAMDILLQRQTQGALTEASLITKSPVLPKPTMQVGAARTLSSGQMGGRGSLQNTSAATLNLPQPATATGPGRGSLAPNVATAVLTCSADPTFRILHISGGTGPATFTQQQGQNFYTVTGCSFGNPGVNARVYVYSGGNFHLDFQVEEWEDTGIKMRLDPALRGLMDHDNLTLVIQRNDGKQFTKSGFKFYAAREHMLLEHFPRSSFSLNQFTPTKTSDLSAQFSSPSSKQVEPGISGYTAGIAWQCSDCDYNRDRPTISHYTPSGEDIYTFKSLQPGFVATDASLVYADLVCPSGPLHREGSFGLRWVGDDLHVQWQGQTCTTNGCGGFGQPDCFISLPGSNYAVRLWVEGPRGVDPWSGKPR
ncbi:MAG TPA: hypothetical protein VF135_10055 [Terriglobales bacterium]